jgi:predicted PurR-regulated permease PerM
MNSRSLLRLAIVAVAVWLIFLLRSIMVPLFTAYLLMLLWMPAHRRFSRVLGPTGAALACMFITVLTPLLLVLATIPDLGHLGSYLADADLEALQTWVESTLASLQEKLPGDWMERLKERGISSEKALERANDAAQFMVTAGQWLLGFFGGILGVVSFLVLLPIFLFYLLAGAPWLDRLRRELPAHWHERFDRLMPRIEDILCSFLRSRFIVSVVKGVIAFAVLFALGFPGAFTLALLLGIFSILPVIGPFVAFIAVGLVGLVDGGHTGGGLVGLGVAAGLSVSLELLEGYVLLPRIVGKGLGLSDFAVVLAMLFGAALGGFLGVLVAVPVVAISGVLYAEFLRPVMQDPGPKRGK